MILQIMDIPVEVERKPIRNMHLSVYPPDARVHLSMPLYLTEADARAMILKKWNWICRSREKVLAQPRQMQREYISGESHYLLGKRFMLIIEPITSGTNTIELRGNQMIMRCRPTATRDNRRNQLQEWYRIQLRQILEGLMAKWTEQLHESDVTWQIKLMRTEWGSCNHRRRSLLFNLDLARVPVECIEYIVVHELSHLRVHNHGTAFQALMTERLPNWKLLRQQINDFIALPIEDENQDEQNPL